MIVAAFGGVVGAGVLAIVAGLVTGGGLFAGLAFGMSAVAGGLPLLVVLGSLLESVAFMSHAGSAFFGGVG